MILTFDRVGSACRSRDAEIRDRQRASFLHRLAANVATPLAYRFARREPFPGLTEDETIVLRHLNGKLSETIAGRKLFAAAFTTPEIRRDDDEMLRVWKKLVKLYQERPRAIRMLEGIADQLLALPSVDEKGGA